jgi:membrane-associated protein
LAVVIANYHSWFYLIFFIVIFCETGLVVTPFLPGDSLLFIAGALAGSGQLNLAFIAIVVFFAAFLGDNSNYFIGKYLGERLFKNPKSKIFRRDLLDKTNGFYERHGRKTVILARFIPLVRTFAPFVAGVGHMPYARFITFSSIGSLLWVVIFCGGGYLFGNLDFVQKHLSVIILVVVAVSVLPILKMVYDEIKYTKK